MNWLDIVILIIMGISVFSGLKQGLVTSVLSLLGFIVGIVLASNFYKQLGNAMGFISNDNVANIVAFIIIFAVVMVIAAIAAGLIKTILKAVMLGWVDHLGGAFFGLVASVLTISALLAILVKYTSSSIFTESALAGFFLDKFPIIMGFLPSEFDAIRNFFK
jgi:membrane protein required for colicin V production